MVDQLTVEAVEQSTYVVGVSFFDEDDNAITPATATWTLTDEAGAVINSREDVAISPAETVDIVLQGDDLAVAANKTVVNRILVVAGTYNSAAGSGLPFRLQVRFEIDSVITE
jgi:hypothetical protein